MGKVDPHIICLTETKLSPTDPTSACFDTTKYEAYRRDRLIIGGAVAGGVIILVKEHLLSEQIHKVEWDNIEIVACMIHFGNKTVLVACIYRSPLSPPDYNLKISQAIEQLSDIRADQYIICGDFNYPKIDWLNHLVYSNNRDVMRDDRRFYDATQNSFLHQHVDEATRFRGSNIPSLLDLVLTKNEFEIEHIEYQTSFGNSDHCVLFFNFTLEGVLTPEEHDVPKPKIFKGDYPGMSNIFLTEWQVNNSQKDPQGKWDVLHNLYKIASERFIPIGHSSGNTPRNKWMTRKALQAIDIKENKWNVYKNNQTDTNLKFIIMPEMPQLQLLEKPNITLKNP